MVNPYGCAPVIAAVVSGDSVAVAGHPYGHALGVTVRTLVLFECVIEAGLCAYACVGIMVECVVDYQVVPGADHIKAVCVVIIADIVPYHIVVRKADVNPCISVLVAQVVFNEAVSTVVMDLDAVLGI